MSRKPESKLVEKIMEALPKDGFFFKVHGGPFQRRGVADILGCYKGRSIAIEVKMPGKIPTDLQLDFLEKMAAAGARCGVAYSVEQALFILRNKSGKYFYQPS